MSDDRRDDDLTAPERSLYELLGLLRGETITAAPSFGPAVVRRARRQRAMRHAVTATFALLAAVVDGAGDALRGGRRER